MTETISMAHTKAYQMNRFTDYYRGRILFAGGNGRRSGAISAGKSFTTAVHVCFRLCDCFDYEGISPLKPIQDNLWLLRAISFPFKVCFR